MSNKDANLDPSLGASRENPPATDRPSADAADTSPAIKASTGVGLLSRRAALASLLVLTLFSGVVHGFLDGRWSTPADMQAKGKLLDQIPQRFGDWALTESTPLDDGAARLLRCYGANVGVYKNEKTSDVVSAALLFGPRGPIAVHTPEVCYSSIGTTQVGETVVETISTTTRQHQFWSAEFAENSQPDPTLSVWYAWSDGGTFQASRYPRVWLTESLYKIQVAGPIGTASNEPCRVFLEAFLSPAERVMQ